MSIVPPYTIQQQIIIHTSKAPMREDGPKAMPPTAEPKEDWLPPPISKTDLWSAQQTFPL